MSNLANKKSEGTADSGKTRVMLVDDSLVIRGLISRWLDAIDDIEVVASCRNGQDALDRIGRSPVDVVVLDVEMPVMDGLEAAREVRRNYPVKDAPWIIAVTANAMEGDRQRCLVAGMNDYISKPLKVEQVKAAMNRARRALAGEELKSRLG